MPVNQPSAVLFRTRWSLIERARAGEPGSAAVKSAITELLLHYRPAILGAIRRHGIDSAESEDLCQEFLVRVFLSKTLPRADRTRGRFRTFLLHSLRHFVASWQRSAAAVKRGAGRQRAFAELSPGELDEALAFEEPQAELEFEMEFARCLHAQVLARLQDDYAADNRQRVFEVLAPLILQANPPSSDRLAADLGLSPTAARQALSRLRHRYVEAFQGQVAQIVDTRDDLRAETKDLLKLVWVSLNLAPRDPSASSQRDW